MGSVTGYTAAKMQQLVNSMIKSARVSGDDLILTRYDGTEIDAGMIRGPKGDPGNNVDAKAYSDAGDATTLTSAKSYSDGKLTEAKSYSDGKLTEAKSYTDAEVEFRKQTSISQRVMNGGGVRKVDSTTIGWTFRFIIMGLGQKIGASGFFNVDMPPDGTVVPVYGSSALTSVTVSGGKIPFINWDALYYSIPFGQASSASVPGNFFIVQYTSSNAPIIPKDAVLIAVRNGDSKSPSILWGDGRQQDFWRSLTLINGWLNYGSSWPLAGWRFKTDGQLELRGLVKSGATGTISSVPAEFAPEGNASTGKMFLQAANGGAQARRVDVHGDGTIVAQAPPTSVDAGYLSLDGMHWFPNAS